MTDRDYQAAEEHTPYKAGETMTAKEREKVIRQLEKEMKTAAAALEFETAAKLRDQIMELIKKQEEEMGDIDE